MSDTPKFNNYGRPKCGFAAVGATAVAVAVVVQFAVAGPDAAALPGFLAVGKLALTIPLVVLGLGLIARDAIKNMYRGTTIPTSSGRWPPSTRGSRTRRRRGTAHIPSCS